MFVNSIRSLSRHFKCHTSLSLDKQDVLIKFGQKLFESLISVSNRLYRFELVSSLNAIGYLIKVRTFIKKTHTRTEINYSINPIWCATI